MLALETFWDQFAQYHRGHWI